MNVVMGRCIWFFVSIELGVFVESRGWRVKVPEKKIIKFLKRMLFARVLMETG